MPSAGAWIDRIHDRKPPRGIILDMDSSESPTHGQQEGSVWNGHFGCTCYHPLFVFNQFGDLERIMLRRGNHLSAKFWRRVLLPVIARLIHQASPRAEGAFERLLYTVLQHIFLYHELHGDLHPGNVMIGSDGTLHLIDWGNVVQLEGTTGAAPAIDRAEGFAEVQGLSRSLERRVAERTTELAETNRQLTERSEAVELLKTSGQQEWQRAALVPMFALGMVPLFRRRRFGEHLVFATHYFAALLLFLGVFGVVALVPTGAGLYFLRNVTPKLKPGERPGEATHAEAEAGWSSVT